MNTLAILGVVNSLRIIMKWSFAKNSQSKTASNEAVL